MVPVLSHSSNLANSSTPSSLFPGDCRDANGYATFFALPSRFTFSSRTACEWKFATTSPPPGARTSYAKFSVVSSATVSYTYTISCPPAIWGSSAAMASRERKRSTTSVAPSDLR